MPKAKPPPSPAAIHQRARDLRRPLTPTERLLWLRLRDQQLGGYKFRRQHPLGNFIVDFYCPACRLVVEVDGETYAAQAAYDAARTEWLATVGCRVVRFTNGEVRAELEGVLLTILAACAEAGAR